MILSPMITPTTQEKLASEDAVLLLVDPKPETFDIINDMAKSLGAIDELTLYRLTADYPILQDFCRQAPFPQNDWQLKLKECKYLALSYITPSGEPMSLYNLMMGIALYNASRQVTQEEEKLHLLSLACEWRSYLAIEDYCQSRLSDSNAQEDLIEKTQILINNYCAYGHVKRFVILNTWQKQHNITPTMASSLHEILYFSYLAISALNHHQISRLIIQQCTQSNLLAMDLLIHLSEESNESLQDYFLANLSNEQKVKVERSIEHWYQFLPVQ
jgi:hypothetical protein